MPIRLGFRQYRQQVLLDEKSRILEILPSLGIEKAILLNNLDDITNIEPDTSIKLVLIMEKDWPFVRRMDFFYSHILPRTWVEFLVYTPLEFESITSTSTYLSKAIQKGQVLIE